MLEKTLRLMAKAVLLKYRPIVVGITGSVGKSSTKEAVALVLSVAYDVRKSEGNYNNELGVPLTILGEKSGGRSPFRWFFIVLRWLGKMIFPIKYPEVLVLEMAVDRLGDMSYLLDFVPVNVGIVTRIGESHLEHFKTIAGIAKEKGKLVTDLPEDGVAVLNADDERVAKLAEKTKAKVLFYSIERFATISGEHYAYDDRTGVGWTFKLNYDGKSVPVRLPNIVGKHLIGSALAAVAAGIALKMNLVEIASALESFESLPGRMRMISGKNGALLIDDTYNAAPTSLMASLETFSRIVGRRKILALGDMLELGPNAEQFHRNFAEKIVPLNCAGVFLVGPMMMNLADELRKRGFSLDRLFLFDRPEDCGEALAAFLRAGDIALLKGSQGMRMEKATECAMMHPEDATKLLPRQSPEWRKKPFNSHI